jgi:hypothetical protein
MSFFVDYFIVSVLEPFGFGEKIQKSLFVEQ